MTYVAEAVPGLGLGRSAGADGQRSQPCGRSATQHQRAPANQAWNVNRRLHKARWSASGHPCIGVMTRLRPRAPAGQAGCGFVYRPFWVRLDPARLRRVGQGRASTPGWLVARGCALEAAPARRARWLNRQDGGLPGWVADAAEDSKGTGVQRVGAGQVAAPASDMGQVVAYSSGDSFTTPRALAIRRAPPR
jgi:hypothetical protein